MQLAQTLGKWWTVENPESKPGVLHMTVQNQNAVVEKSG